MMTSSLKLFEDSDCGY